MTATKSISSTEVQNKFGQVMNDVTQNQTRYIIERRGTPQAIILGFDDFTRLLNNDLERHHMNSILREVRPMYELGRTISHTDSSSKVEGK
jgi:prevent-host-death family protein